MDATCATLSPSPVKQSEWFRDWFDSPYYHKLYSYRDDREAAGFIDQLLDHLQPSPGSAMIDLGCGTGRHSRHLASKGYRVTGLDLAGGSIARAKNFETASLRFLRHDMRQSIGRCHADYVFNLFTSFGYFSDQENHAVMRNISDALKPGGTLVVDYLNVNYAEARLVPSEEKEIDRAIYNITRWTDQDHFFKKITVLDERTGQVLEYTERVAKLTLEDFDDMLAQEHLQSESAYGDYGLNTYDEAKSPRMIIVARKPGANEVPAFVRGLSELD